MARSERKVMADMRALEEEAERYNPVNPVRKSTRMGYTGLVRGSGATPSMGLSTVRGGALLGESGHGQRVVGAGTKKGQMRKTSRKAYEMTGGAKEMGAHLSSRLMELHGKGFWDDFKSGFMSVISPVASIAKPLLPMLGPEGAAASAVMGAVGLGKRGGLRTGAYEGKGKLKIEHDESSESESEEKCGGAKKKSVSDKRKARGAMVSKLMKTKGFTLAEASKYIKQHSLV